MDRLKVGDAVRGFFLASVACLLLAPLGAGAQAAQGPHYAVYFTAEETNGVPQKKPATSFGCSGKVYGVLEISGLDHGKHRVDVWWIDPSGRRRERTRFPFQVFQDKHRIWAWLRLIRSKDSVVDRVFMGNAASGMEDFIGKWTVKFRVDRRLVKKSSFKVIC
ncbi:MAG: hypothetical protein GXP09_02220 [Gammaproteobacteria bacterium]|nr:hypothetical protein [Gammaproteobacteria bacterium]